jgi:preprotein translocase SecF subunit
VLSLGAIVLYLAFRFNSARFGVTATFATFHDVLAMLGVFWLLGKEIDLLLVVALLTIAGYSLTDTVVVFDRIRETLARGRQPADQVINRSINEVLSRSIVTALTTFISSLCLLFFGGEVLRDFALALTIGIVVGSYSSIFVAAPILYVWGLPSTRPASAPAPPARPARSSGRPVRGEGVPTR